MYAAASVLRCSHLNRALYLFRIVEVYLKEVEVVKVARCFEAMGEILCRLLGLVLVYVMFEFIGTKVVGASFQKDTLLSLVVLPAIYVLKDLHTIIEPFFVKVWMNEESVKVQSGILTQRIDNLILKNVENVELTKSPIGRVFGYTTLCLYAYGSWVELPFVKSCLAEDLHAQLSTV
ncbi:hypothetical protein ACX11_21500 [Vibrio parahaemolyticus]|nr:hypothetical protein ACX11_21500 [Vibrio parahaemolyticus]